jgi:hypothetical protein
MRDFAPEEKEERETFDTHPEIVDFFGSIFDLLPQTSFLIGVLVGIAAAAVARRHAGY